MVSCLLLLLLLPRLSLQAAAGGLSHLPAGAHTRHTSCLQLLEPGDEDGAAAVGETLWASTLQNLAVVLNQPVNRATINTNSNINKNTTHKNSVSNCSSKKGKYCDKNNVARDDLVPVTTPVVDDLVPVTTPVVDDLVPVTTPVVDDLAPMTTPVVDGISSPPLERFLGWWPHKSASLEANTTVTTTPASSINTSASLSDGLTGTVCGLSGRIVGGIESEVGAWPWAVLISNKHGEPFCGGTLISLRHVLTAAHCTTGKEIEKMYPISVRVGEHDLMDPSESPSQTLGVAYALFHSDFGKEAQFDSDVALLVLSAALDPRLNLMPACLPGPDYSVAGSVVTVVGWGATHEGGASSNILREAHIPVLQESTCQTSYPGSFLPEKMICAGYLVGRTDTCQGCEGRVEWLNTPVSSVEEETDISLWWSKFEETRNL